MSHPLRQIFKHLAQLRKVLGFLFFGDLLGAGQEVGRDSEDLLLIFGVPFIVRTQKSASATVPACMDARSKILTPEQQILDADDSICQSSSIAHN